MAESEIVLPPKNKLLRILGLGFGLAVVVGGTIGVSIFRLPGPTANLLGNTWLILAIWTLGGAFTLLNANYTAELATMIPKAGGPTFTPTMLTAILPASSWVGAIGWAMLPRLRSCDRFC